MDKMHKPLTIKDWSPDEQPRERLERHGAATLADAELLAIMFRTGTQGTSALDMARGVLARKRGLPALASTDVATLAVEYGLGRVRAVTLVAAFELGRRAQVKRFDANERIRQPRDLADRYIPAMRDLPHEEFWVVHLNRANMVIRHCVIARGGMSASVVDPHEVFREAIVDRAASIVLLHNHPSGNPEPSREDLALTRALVDAGAVLQLPVTDHLIIAGSNYTSLKERKVL